MTDLTPTSPERSQPAFKAAVKAHEYSAPEPSPSPSKDSPADSPAGRVTRSKSRSATSSRPSATPSSNLRASSNQTSATSASTKATPASTETASESAPAQAAAAPSSPAPKPASKTAPARRIQSTISSWTTSTRPPAPSERSSATAPSSSSALTSTQSPSAGTSQRTTSPTKPTTAVHSGSLKRKRSAGYAAPSTFAHVANKLSDTLPEELICVFIGLNPGLTTATTGHAYAHPSNLFWRLLASSGCTGRRCQPRETYILPRLYGLGNTNIVERPTANGAQLSKAEMDEGVAVLDRKVAACRPLAVAIVGKSIWESIWRVWMGRAIRKDEFKYGWQEGDGLRMGRPGRSGVKKGEVGAEGEERWRGARVFVATSTSGLAAGMKPHEKEEVWRGLGEWVEKEREKRGLVGDRYLEDGEVVTRES